MRLGTALVATVIGSALVAAIWGTTLQRVAAEHAAELDAVNRSNANLAIAYAENVQSRFDEVDRLLLLLRSGHASHGAAVAGEMEDWPLDHALVRWMAVFDEQGRLATSSKFRPPWTDAAAREFFTAHRDAEHPGLFIGRAERHFPAHQEWSMVLSRRHYDRHGAFRGVVAAEIDPAQLTSFHNGVDLGANGGVTLLGLDGFARVRLSSSVLSYDQDMRDSLAIQALATAARGNLVGRGRFDGVRRHYAFQRLRHYPLAVTVGTDTAQVFSAANARRRVYHGIAWLATAAIAAITLLVARSFWRQRRHLDALARSEAAASASEARLRAVVACANDGIVVYDRELHIADVNPAAERILGIPRAELVGRAGLVSVFSCVNADGSPMTQEDRPTRIAMRTGQPQADRLIGLCRAPGQIQWLSFNVAKISAADSTDWTGMVSTFADVTEVRRIQDALRENEAFYRATFDQDVVGIGHADLDGCILGANRRLGEMLGYAEGELIGHGVMEVVLPEDRAATARAMETLLEHPGAGRLRPDVRRFRRKDGTEIWGLTSTALLRDAHGAPAYFLGMVQDVTELKRVEQRKDEFTSTVSHELRTPLTSIRGSLGLLAGGVAGAIPPAAGRLVDVALANCERLILLVNDILDLEKIASGKMRFEPRQVVLGAVVADCVAANEGFARAHGVTLRITGGDLPARCEIDPERFGQVLTNLLSNAVKYSPRGEAVVVSLEVRDARARIEVRDRGPGIPEEFRARIFQRFSQADGSDSRRKGGTGLGLCIARSMVERMGGTIGYDTVPGAGTTFFIELPLAPEAPAARPQPQAETA